MLQAETFVRMYEHIQGILISNPGYEILKKREAHKKAECFLEKHPNIIGKLYNFITFIFVLRTSKYSRYKVIPFTQFTSENAYKLYSEIDSQQSYFISKFQIENNLKNPIIEETVLSEEYLDLQRQKYFGEPRGFLLCRSFGGLLYNRGKCIRCKFNYICRDEKR